jgi:triosephosphate isomerase
LGNIVLHTSQYGLSEPVKLFQEQEEMHEFIRETVQSTEAISQKMFQLYGGSVKPENAKEIF